MLTHAEVCSSFIVHRDHDLSRCQVLDQQLGTVAGRDTAHTVIGFDELDIL